MLGKSEDGNLEKGRSDYGALIFLLETETGITAYGHTRRQHSHSYDHDESKSVMLIIIILMELKICNASSIKPMQTIIHRDDYLTCHSEMSVFSKTFSLMLIRYSMRQQKIRGKTPPVINHEQHLISWNPYFS